MSDNTSKANEHNYFNTLVEGIDDGERRELLNKIGKKQNDDDEISFPLEESGGKFALMREYKKCSFLERIIMRIIGFFTSMPLESVVNEHFVGRIAHKVEHSCPGLIFYKKRVLSDLFYEKIYDLKNAVDFFSSSIKVYEKNRTASYIAIGNIICPDIEDRVANEFTSVSVPLDCEITPEMKRNRLTVLLRIIDGISEAEKNRMGLCIKGISWLSAINRIRMNETLSKFVPHGEGKHECPFTLAQQDIIQLAKAMRSAVPLDETIIHIFNTIDPPKDDDGKTDEQATENLFSFAKTQLKIITRFADIIPMSDVVKIVMGDALFRVGVEATIEDWFSIYRKGWNKEFEKRIESWCEEHKRAQLKAKLMKYFAVPDFPQFPHRPWEQLWDGVKFRRETSLGLVDSFMEEKYVLYAKVLKALQLGGDFYAQENRQELMLVVDDFAKVDSMRKTLRDELCTGGSHFLALKKLPSKVPPSHASEIQAEKVFSAVEHEVLDMEKLLGLVCCRLMNLLEGFLSNRTFGRYCKVTNLSQLFYDDIALITLLADCNRDIQYLYEIMKEIELIEENSK